MRMSQEQSEYQSTVFGNTIFLLRYSLHFLLYSLTHITNICYRSVPSLNSFPCAANRRNRNEQQNAKETVTCLCDRTYGAQRWNVKRDQKKKARSKEEEISLWLCSVHSVACRVHWMEWWMNSCRWAGIEPVCATADLHRQLPTLYWLYMTNTANGSHVVLYSEF